MELISVKQRSELLKDVRETLKLEHRDFYAVDADDLALFVAGDLDAVAASYQVWADSVAEMEQAGEHLRRVRVISEPLSDYQRMAVQFSGPAVDAGEDLRWLPRRLTSTLPLPGNDFFVLDGHTALFNVMDGNGDRAEIQLYTEPEVVKLCLEAFEAAWAVAIPHREYKPT
ncbi:DUF6879 family protein [Streptosporangium carneum]|uniref:DUF6879 domain-containing protein n=1 Tax=Streptosporangium carneum TaxID=47481 RepID=A0A9W6HYH6_9ACTN|nr:DUF6879 family protein [Streptosporangium carneum]GLK08422.1 hypothetical protein GCM10017600_18270 [Streptosporangium carneum]